jgi:hypothetical protein
MRFAIVCIDWESVSFASVLLHDRSEPIFHVRRCCNELVGVDLANSRYILSQATSFRVVTARRPEYSSPTVRLMLTRPFTEYGNYFKTLLIEVELVMIK